MVIIKKDCKKLVLVPVQMRLLGQFYTFFFFTIRFYKYKKALKSIKKHQRAPKSTKEHRKASKGTTNLKFIDLKFINIRFINLKYSASFILFFFYDKNLQVQKSIKKHQKALKGTKRHN